MTPGHEGILIALTLSCWLGFFLSHLLSVYTRCQGLFSVQLSLGELFYTVLLLAFANLSLCVHLDKIHELLLILDNHNLKVLSLS